MVCVVIDYSFIDKSVKPSTEKRLGFSILQKKIPSTKNIPKRNSDDRFDYLTLNCVAF